MSLTSIKQAFSFSTNSLVQKSVAYTGTEPKKDELVLEGAETDQEVGQSVEQFAITGTFYLSR